MRLLALAFVATLCLVAFVPAPADEDRSTFDGLQLAFAQLRGAGIPTDFAADVVGARALLDDGSAYPVLGPAFSELGIEWNVENPNTHPPTAFVLALPVAWLSWPLAQAIWAWMMVGAFAVTGWALGARPLLALALAPAWLLWPPAAWSLGQTTPLWLAGAAVAFRFRHRPDLAGAAIAVATLPKLLPVLLLVPFLQRRQWRVLVGFATVLGAAIAIVLVLNASAIREYLTVGRAASLEVANDAYNGALLVAVLPYQRWLLLAAGMAILVAAIVARARWAAWEWLAVALLPIAWIYSLLPLALPLWRAIISRHTVATVAAGAAIGMPLVGPPFGSASQLVVAGTVVAAGVAVFAPRLLAIAHAGRFARAKSTEYSSRSPTAGE
jgi:Glycosyltransferase family 87